MKILIVDDSDAMRRIIKRVLKSFPWKLEVVEARDGRQAIEVFGKERPQLVITDWNMPTIDGLSLVSAFIRNGINVPIGMVTGNGSADEVAQAKATGAAFVVTKPFVPEDLRVALSPFIAGADELPRPALEPVQPIATDLIDELVSALNYAVDTQLIVEDGLGCDVTGSAGAVFSVANQRGVPLAVIAIDWQLLNYLAYAMAGPAVGDPVENINHMRITPQVQQTADEIGNLLRGVLRNSLSGEFVDVYKRAFRGDGQLRHDYWRILTQTQSFVLAKRHDITLRVSGIGEGGFSYYALA